MPDEHADDRRPSALWLPLLLALLAGAALLWWMAARSDERQPAGNSATSPSAALGEDPLIQGEGLGNGAAGPEAWSEARWQQLEQQAGRAPPATAPAGTLPAAEAPAAAARPPERRNARANSTATSFDALDRNNDGRLSPAEFAVFHLPEVQPARQGAKADDMPPYVSTNALNRSIGAFRRLDRNDDWFISRAEFGSLRQTG